jgi:hypothetical protein
MMDQMQVETYMLSVGLKKREKKMPKGGVKNA